VFVVRVRGPRACACVSACLCVGGGGELGGFQPD
jgi:hypothetical protein